MLRLNLGCCDLPMPREEGWVNIDKSTDPRIRADITADVTKLDDVFTPSSVDEIFAAHLVEHLTPTEAEAAVEQWVSLIKPGGILGIVTPDFRWMAETYLSGETSMHDLNDIYVYSYCQESLHRSLWDQDSLDELLKRHGLSDIRPIDRHDDPRLAFPADYQCGAQGIKS